MKFNSSLSSHVRQNQSGRRKRMHNCSSNMELCIYEPYDVQWNMMEYDTMEHFETHLPLNALNLTNMENSSQNGRLET
jgi:hypothetical protein